MPEIEDDNFMSGIEEAVIISGPLRGELVRIRGGRVIAEPEEGIEAAFDELTTLAERVAANVNAAAGEARAMRDSLKPIRDEECAKLRLNRLLPDKDSQK